MSCIVAKLNVIFSDTKLNDDLWVPVNSIGKVSDGWIGDLEINPTYTKNLLVSWSDDKELSLEANIIGWNSLKKLKKLKDDLVYETRYYFMT